MSRLNRGVISRAASALIFCAAAAVLLVFPEGEAGGGRSSFAPAQVPPVGATTDEEFRSADLCQRLGGSVRPEANGSVCAQVDAHGTFCIIGSADIFPCRGLLKQVIRCNAKYNRPALNPFLCGIRCAPGPKSPRRKMRNRRRPRPRPPSPRHNRLRRRGIRRPRPPRRHRRKLHSGLFRIPPSHRPLPSPPSPTTTTTNSP